MSETRLHLMLPEVLMAKVPELQRAAGASSMSELVRSALALYSAALDEHRAGGCVFLRGSDGVERQVILPVLRGSHDRHHPG